MNVNVSQQNGVALHNLRRRVHVTLEALALASSISPSTLSNYERGKKTLNDETYIRLVFALNSIASPSPRRKHKSYPGQTGLSL